MSEINFHSPLKIGLITVVTAYFLFTLHALLTVSWVGEWESLGPVFGFVIYIEDVAATAGMVFRFVASLIAFVAVIIYVAKKNLPERATKRILMAVLVCEAIYWLGLLPSGFMPIVYLRPNLFALFSSDIPCLVESTAIPAALLMLAVNFRRGRPAKQSIRWSLVSGTVYVFVFWLVNTGIWVSTLRTKGLDYLTVYPENLASFALTVFGLLAFTVIAARFTKKSWGAKSLYEVNLRTVGALITFLGLWFLWNYLTWIFFGRNELWSAWYAWFLGHNLDLWLLTLPLVGLPLMYLSRNKAPSVAGKGSNV
jgi:hypothetical protein